jgi:hypothetical protein
VPAVKIPTVKSPDTNIFPLKFAVLDTVSVFSCVSPEMYKLLCPVMVPTLNKAPDTSAFEPTLRFPVKV